MSDIFIGIDLGGTGLKAVALESGSGATLASACEALPYQNRPDGACELTGVAIRHLLTFALQAVSRQLGARAGRVRAIGCTGHGAGLYALDAKGWLLRGRAVAPADQRAAQRAKTQAARHGELLFNEVGCKPWAGQPAVIAAELMSSGELDLTELRHLLFAKDYVAYLLCGEMATDASAAGAAGLLSLATGRWSALALEMAALSELGERALPALVPGGTTIGRLRPMQAAECGLPVGVPVATGTIDLWAALTACGAVRHGQQVAVFGAGGVNAMVAPAREPKPDVAAILPSGLVGQADLQLYMQNSPSSMVNLDWLAHLLQLPSAASIVEMAMSAPPDAAGLRFASLLDGGADPPGTKLGPLEAGFLGLTRHHGRSHLARAVVDTVIEQHACHLSALQARRLCPPDGVLVLGEGSQHRRLVQLLASALGQAVDRCSDDDAGALGAAMLAAQSQGVSFDAPIATLERVEPGIDVDTGTAPEMVHTEVGSLGL